MSVTIDDVRAAARAIAGGIARTPCVLSETLSEIAGASLYLKFESLQFTASFKERGALYKLLSLGAAERRAGVVAMSAGNHAQAVAHHARRLGIAATIVMPKDTPFIKIRNTEFLGARVAIEGDSLTEAAAHAHGLAERHGLIFVHPYDDERIIAGQGTATLEMMEQVPELDVVVMAIGGGGLIAGGATAAKAVKPDIEVIGVEAALYPAMVQALRGQPTTAHGHTIAEGIAVKQPGALTTPIVRALVDDIVLVDEAALERAVQMIIEVEKMVAEGAGAAPLAAVLSHPARFAGKRVGLVIGGGNIDSRLLAQVLMRGLVRAGRLVQIRVEVSDLPGSLAEVTGLIAGLGANILEVAHQRWFYDVPVKLTEVDFTLETVDPENVRKILGGLTAAGLPARLLSSTLDGGAEAAQPAAQRE